MAGEERGAKTTIGRKISVKLAGVTVGVLFLFTLLLVTFSQRNLENELKERVAQVVSHAQYSLATALWQFNETYVSDYLDSLFISTDVMFVEVIAEGAVVATKTREGLAGDGFLDFRSSRRYISESAVISYGEHPVGEFHVAVSRERMSRALYNETLSAFVLMVSMVAAIILTTLYLTRRYVLIPLKNLQASAARIAGGDLGESIDLASWDEIGELSRHLDLMRVNIRRSFEEVKKTDALRKTMVRLEMEIEERGEVEATLKASLHEKEVLLKEVHHRVKNNLQVIQSLLRLQESRLESPELKAPFLDSENRIQAMALVHESLYRSESLVAVDLDHYVHRLLTGLFASHGMTADRIHRHVEIAPVYLDMDQTIACGLIITELVSNSLKHAFDGVENGSVSVTLLHGAEGGQELKVWDNGCGMTLDVAARDPQSLGLKLVRLLVEDQLEGELRVEGSKGASFTVLF